MERKILYLEPEKAARKRMAEKIDSKDFDIQLESVASAEEAMEKLKQKDFNVLITEYNLPTEDVEKVIEFMKEHSPKTVSVLFSDADFEDISEEAIVKAHGYTDKDQEGAFRKILEQMKYLMRDRSKTARPVPDDEKQRLESIKQYDIEKMIESGDFDRLTKIGSELFDTRFCFFGIIREDVEEFISFEGSETTQMNRECTICTFTINQDEVMEVENTEEDERFKFVDSLHDKDIKWYAGAPVTNKDGYKIGAFCVADSETKEFTEKDRELLRLFAEEAAEKIETKFRKKGLIQKIKDLI